MHHEFTPAQINMFWAQVDQSGDCWVWQGDRRRGGYGSFCWWDGAKVRRTSAHRVAYQLANGSIPLGLHVLHDCDTRACVNPQHLWAGTQTDNMRDMARKGRHAAQVNPKAWAAHCAPLPHPKGEDSPQAKLTEQEVIEIRRLYAQGEGTYRGLAKRFGVGKTTISHVISRRDWAHVE